VKKSSVSRRKEEVERSAGLQKLQREKESEREREREGGEPECTRRERQ